MVPGLLNSDDVTTRKYTCRVLPNIASGTKEQLKIILFEKRIISKLLGLVSSDEVSVKAEIFIILTNCIWVDKDNKEDNEISSSLMEIFVKNSII